MVHLPLAVVIKTRIFLYGVFIANGKPTTGLPPHSGLSAPFVTASLAFLSRRKEKLKVCNMACSVAFLTALLGQVNHCFIRVF